MKREDIVSLRMIRQHLADPVSEDGYEALFKDMSPVLTEYWCCPGQAPCLEYRANFDDLAYCDEKRSKRRIVKGRFQNGGIAYIYQEELELFAAAYRKKGQLSMMEAELLELLEREGPMTIHVIKEYTGLLTKQITPALHKLQEKFLVFEDQADSEWDRGWYAFPQEFPEVNLERYTKEEAIRELILRFAYRNVWFQPKMVRSFYRFTVKEIQRAIDQLVDAGKLEEVDGGYIRPEDETMDVPTVGRGAFLLNRNDYLVKSNEDWLKETFRHEKYDTLGYFLIDGEFHGFLAGKFHNGPHELKEIVLDLPERYEDALEAVEVRYGRDAVSVL